MNDSTLSFLQSIGADAIDGDNCSFSGEPDRFDEVFAQNVIVPLSHDGVLEARGPDAEKFLQGQVTCNAAEVTPVLSSPGAYCTPKGRVVTNFQLLRPERDVFWLRTRADLLDIAARIFGKYIVFSKAKLAEIDAVGIGLRGENIASLLRGLIGELPARLHGTVSHGGGLLRRCNESGSQYEYWGPVAAAVDFWTQCAPHCRALGSRYWRWLQIRDRNADICAATSEMFLPHMLNYHETGAINFQKGCYTGQEIVARTHYRGQVKRHLLRAAFDGPAVAPGSEITDAGGKAVGHVVDSVATSPAAAEMLGVVAVDSVETSASPRIGGVEVRPIARPYAIP